MKYPNIQRATFLSRPNRFVAYCRLESGETVRCHVKNTGRCRELLAENADGNCTVLLVKADKEGRSTAYDLVAVYKGEKLINMDSSAPNRGRQNFCPSSIPICKNYKPNTLGETPASTFIWSIPTASGSSR